MILTYQSMSMSLLIRSLSNLVTVKNMRLYIWVLRLDYIKGQFLVRNVQTRVIIRFSQIWKAKIQPNFWFRLESFGHRCLQLHLDEVTMEGISKFHPKNTGPFVYQISENSNTQNCELILVWGISNNSNWHLWPCYAMYCTYCLEWNKTSYFLAKNGKFRP